MQKFEYKTLLLDTTEDVDVVLNKYGADGWRLHTCEPVPVYGPQGTGMPKVFVAFDKWYEEEEMPVEPDTGVQGIEMKSGPS